MSNKEKITVSAVINCQINKVWEFWNGSNHITQWNFASDEWCAPSADVDFKVGGKFSNRMEAKDGSMGFDFNGTYTAIHDGELVAYDIEDGRKVEVRFESKDNQTVVTETFEAEDMNSIDLQRAGWQAILDNFKKYAESKSK